MKNLQEAQRTSDEFGLNELGYEPFLLSGRCWKVRFIGESVDDCGGGYSDSIAEICDELQSFTGGESDLPILVQIPNCVDMEQDHSKVFVFNPLRAKSDNIKSVEKLFIFLGNLIGCALRQGSPLSLRLHDSMWKLLQGEELCLADIFDMDSAFHQRVNFILSSTTDFSEASVVTLSGEEIHCRSQSRAQFLQSCIRIRNAEFKKCADLVRFGIGEVVPLRYLNIFTVRELCHLVSGEIDIPIGLLKKVTTYKGIEPDSNYANWFWEVLSEFSAWER